IDVDRRVVEVDVGNAELPGQRHAQGVVGDEAELDENLAERSLVRFLPCQSDLQLRPGDRPTSDQELAEPGVTGPCPTAILNADRIARFGGYRMPRWSSLGANACDSGESRAVCVARSDAAVPPTSGALRASNGPWPT